MAGHVTAVGRRVTDEQNYNSSFVLAVAVNCWWACRLAARRPRGLGQRKAHYVAKELQLPVGGGRLPVNAFALHDGWESRFAMRRAAFRMSPDYHGLPRGTAIISPAAICRRAFGPGTLSMRPDSS